MTGPAGGQNPANGARRPGNKDQNNKLKTFSVRQKIFAAYLWLKCEEEREANGLQK